MEDKKISNMRFPLAILDEFEEMAAQYGAKQRWVVGSAAVLALMALPHEERLKLVQEVAGADFTNDMKSLVGRYKAIQNAQNRPVKGKRKAPSSRATGMVNRSKARTKGSTKTRRNSRRPPGQQAG